MDRGCRPCDSGVMRADASGRLKLLRVLLAYVLALQALLGAWAGVAQAGSLDFDPTLSLCRTASTVNSQPSDGSHSRPAHCAVMCLSGGCGSAEPPAGAVAVLEYPLALAGMEPAYRSAPTVRVSISIHGLRARGPPSLG